MTSITRISLSESRNESLFTSRTAVVLLNAFVAFLVSITPLLFTTYPPLHDYPNHLARAYILANWDHSALLQTWYQIRPFTIPNLGMDVITLGLAQLVPIESAGRLFIALTLGLMLSGCMALYRALHGHVSVWPLISAFFLFNWIFLFGFLNYLLGVGLLLWAVAIWIVLSRRSLPWLRLVCGTILAVALYFAHLVALGLFAIIVAGYELQRSCLAFRHGRWTALRDLGIGAAIFIVPLVLFVASSTSGEAGNVVRYNTPVLLWKPFAIYRSLMSGDWLLDNLLLAAIIGGAVLVFRQGRLTVAKPMYLALVLLAVAYIVMPWRMFSGYYVDSRLPVAILFVAIGSSDVTLRSRALNHAALALLAVFLVFRSAVLSYDWHRYDRITKEFTEAFAGLPPESILFVANEAPSPSLGNFDLRYWTPPIQHTASLATLQGTVFVPLVWAIPSQQPIAVTDRFAPLYSYHKQNPLGLKDADAFATITATIGHLARDAGGPAASAFLLALYPGDRDLPPPPGTRIVAAGSRFVLLAVDTGQAGNTDPP